MTLNAGVNLMLNVGLGGRRDGPGQDGPGRDWNGSTQRGDGHNGWGDRGFGVGDRGNGLGLGKGGVDLNVNLNVGLGSTLGTASFGSMDANFARPNDEPTDADAVARLRRQSESVDLDSGRDSRSSVLPSRGPDRAGDAASATRTGAAPLPYGTAAGRPGEAGMATGGRSDGALAFSGSAGPTSAPGFVSASAPGAGGTAAAAAHSTWAPATSFAPASSAPAPSAPEPVAGGAIDRLVAALSDQPVPSSSGVGRPQGAGGDAAAAVVPQRTLGAPSVPVTAQIEPAIAARAQAGFGPAGAADPQAAASAQIPAAYFVEPAVRQTPAAQQPATQAAMPAQIVPAASAPPTAASAQSSPAHFVEPAARQTPAAQQPAAPRATMTQTQAGPIAALPTLVQAQAHAPVAPVQPVGPAPQQTAALQTAQAIASLPATTAQQSPTPVSPQQMMVAAPQQAPGAALRQTTITAPQPVATAAPDRASPVGPLAAAAPATGGAPVAQSAFAPVEPIAALGPRPAGEAFVARQIAAIEHVERTAGPAAAARELNGRVRDLPSGSAAQVLAGLQQTLGRAAENYVAGERVDRIERVDGALDASPSEIAARAAMARAGVDLAAALDAGAAEDSGAHVTKAVAQAIATSERAASERLIAFGEAVGFGAGLSLPFALIGALEQRGEHDAARSLETALAGGLARLLSRLTRAVDALSRIAGPVAFDWSAWRASGLSDQERERRLRARLASREGLTAEIDDALEAVETLGADMVRALERLSRWKARTPEVVAVWREATASRKTAFAIAQSLGAQHLVAQALAAGLRVDPPGTPDAFSFEQAQDLYGRFGFTPDGAAELACVSLARHVAVQMAGGWMRARRPRDPSSEAAFQRIARFLNGDCAPVDRHIETVTFADLDPEGERPVTLVGAPLLEKFELLEAA
jgi:hypothetical protein